MVSQIYREYLEVPRYKRDYLTREAFLDDRRRLTAWHFTQALAAAGEVRLCDLCDQPVDIAGWMCRKCECSEEGVRNG